MELLCRGYIIGFTELYFVILPWFSLLSSTVIQSYPDLTKKKKVPLNESEPAEC